MDVTLFNISEEALYDLCHSMEYGNDCFNGAPDQEAVLTQLKVAYKAASGYEFGECYYVDGKRRLENPDGN